MDHEEINDTMGSRQDQATGPSTSYSAGTQDEPDLDLSRSDFELLKRALLNERMAPEILHYKEELVNRIRLGLKRQVQPKSGSAGYLLDNAEARERLSPQERLYSSNFFVVLGRHLKASVLDELPHHYASLVKRYEAEADKKLLDKPDLNKYVFCKVLQDCGQVADGPDGQTAELRKGDMMVIKYTTVAALVQAGQVCLV
eukprot:gene7437-7646_t